MTAPAFSSLPLSQSLLAVVGELGFTALTPIQAACIPALLEGRDLVGQSKTGSGKTAAFTLPILEKLELERRALQALVLCPTRELCAQVARAMRKLGRRHPGLQVLVVSGGEPGRPQARALERGVHVVVGTPGRVLDHLERGVLVLDRVSTLVLDEADRMLDMGFQDQMEQILLALPEARQTMFFSATFPPSIAAMSRNYQRDALRVTIDDGGQIPPEIRQLALVLPREHKLAALCALLEEHLGESALIFCNFKATVGELEETLAELGASVERLHGGLEQFERNQVMAMFRNHSVRVLIATDVAARGLDVPDLDLVINYELPSKAEVYVHRIGRTGRAGQAGLALSLAAAGEDQKLRAIEARTGSVIERITKDFSGRSPKLGARLARPAPMTTIQISGGRKDKLRPGDILGALTGEAAGLEAADIGKIEIHDRLTFVAVARAAGAAALAGLSAGRIKGRRFRATLISAT